MKLIGDIIINFKIRTLSHMAIGNGESVFSDNDIEKINGKPYIPSTAFTGVMRSAFKTMVLPNLNEKEAESFWQFWGTENEDENPYQSHFNISNGSLSNASPNVKIIDGIAINPKTRRVEKTAKFDFEALEPGAEFEFTAHTKLYEKFNIDDFKKLCGTFIKILKEMPPALGANTNAGLGTIELIDRVEYQIFNYKGTDKKDYLAFCNYLSSGVIEADQAPIEAFEIKAKPVFKISGKFKIETHLITAIQQKIRDEPDKIQMYYGEKENPTYVILGQAIKGAISAQYKKIASFFGIDLGKDATLFGGVTTDGATKARLKVHEQTIAAEKHHAIRIKIDRFTNGPIDKAMAISDKISQKENETLTITLEIEEPKNNEMYIMIQVFIDLYDGLVSIGAERSVGSGYLQGLSLTAFYGDDYFKVTNNEPVSTPFFNNLKLETDVK